MIKYINIYKEENSQSFTKKFFKMEVKAQKIIKTNNLQMAKMTFPCKRVVEPRRRINVF